MFLLEKTRSLYGRFERPISSFSLIFGFVFDAITLKRVDTFWENLWIFVHLAAAGLFIALIHIQEGEIGDETNPGKKHFWYVNILQFAFGGLLSTYLVFYFRSADIFNTWPFVALLALAFIINERLKQHYIRFGFQISLFFLSIYAFAIFLVPVVLHKIGPQIFLISGAVSLALISVFIFVLYRFIKKEIDKSKKIIISLILGIFVLINFLYFTNLIPPIPLSLKDAGMYYSIQRGADGYTVTYEDSGWRGYFKLYPDLKKMVGYPVYAYSAIFSPKGLNLTITHEWQRYDTAQGKWVMERIIKLPVIGGREGGFRTFSARSNLTAGRWRVNIKTEQGQTIGHIRFNLIPTDTEPTLKSEIKR